MEEKYYGKVGNMYVSAIFTTSGKLSLSIKMEEACPLDEFQRECLKKQIEYAKIIKVTIKYEEM